MSKAVRSNAKTIGTNDAKSEILAADIRKAWLKAKPEQQAEIAAEFKVGYMAGKERISLSDAQAIFEAGKGKGATKAHIAMIDRATSGFNYHIRNGKTKPASAAAPAKHMRMSADVRQAAKDFLAMFDSVADAKKALDAVAK
jgi:hypothetical protein